MSKIIDISRYLRALVVRRDHGILFSQEVEACSLSEMSDCVAVIEVYSGENSVGLMLNIGDTGILCDLSSETAFALANALLMGSDHANAE